MLLTQRRVAFLHFCLAVMQAAWVTPFVLLLYRGGLQPGGVFALVLGLLLAWMLALELLSLRYETPQYDAISLGLMLLTSVLAVRLLLYPGGAPWSLAWLGQALRDTANFRDGLPPTVLVIGGNLFLWQRATTATSRDLSFFGVGVSFRVGMLLMIAGGAVYSVVRRTDLLALLWVYFAAGLTAIAIARIGEKAIETQSSGAVLPARRMSQVLAAVGVTLGMGALGSLAYTPGGLRAFLRLFAPLWELLGPALLAVLLWIGTLLEPLLLWLESVIVGWMRRGGAAGEEAGSVASPGQAETAQNIPGWPLELIRNVFFIVLIVGALIGLLVFLLLFLERVRRERGRPQGEEEGTERSTFGGSALGRGLAALRDALNLTRRFGLGRRLLAAISVQNIYANLSRIAAHHGRARRPAQPPDEYLPALAAVFPGQDEALQRITWAYMRVHYGDHPVAPAELAALRADYRAVRLAEIERSA